MRRRLVSLVLVSGACLLAGCGSPAAVTAQPTPRLKPTPTPTPRPSATPVPVAPGPYALLVTNGNHQGVTYAVLLVDVNGAIVGRVTARLPLLKPNQTLSISPVSAGNAAAYYLDGDTDIHSLAPGGSTALVKTISAGSSAELGFSVSPDAHLVAVSTISEQSDNIRTSARGYIEDLSDGAGHLDLFSNTGDAAYRWPVAWYGGTVIDAVGGIGYCQQGGYGIGGQSSAIPCAESLHVINATTQGRVATVCEAPATPPSNISYQWFMQGLQSAAGMVCDTSQYDSNSNTESCSLLAVAWTGATRQFDACPAPTAANGASLNESNCFLAPDGSRMACTSGANQALELLKPGGVTHSLGRKYTVLGWIDAGHLMVDIDSSTLAVVNVDTGVARMLSVPSADQVSMHGVVGAA